ncbi:MAG: PUA domain-containing protein [Promethearchaeota archaeon]
MSNDLLLALRRVLAISDYQFGKEITDILFDDIEKIRVIRSKNTNKIRYVYYHNNLMLTLRPTNGFFTLSLFSAKKIIEKTLPPKLRIIVLNGISEFIKEGRNVFCKHVVDIDNNLRAMDEIIVVNQNDELLGIGRLKIPIIYVKSFKSGIAVNVRKGMNKSKL